MKKEEARRQAERIYLEADSKITDMEIAKKVGANRQTVARWKRAGDWEAKLTGRLERADGNGARPVRKKEEHDRALKLYLESQGKITVRELARRVGVNPGSITSWKTSEHWEQKRKESEQRVSSGNVRIEEPVPTAQAREEEKDESVVIDLDELACRSHIARLNKKIDDILGQGYISPTDLKTLAEAKEAVLGVVGAYIGILKKAVDLERDCAG